MQTVDYNQSQMTSLEAVQIQTGEINQRFTNLESFLEQSFQSILTILSQQKSQMDGMSLALGKFKQDSLAMSQQIRSLLFSKKNQVDVQNLAQQSLKQVEIGETGLFSNGFQLGDSLNQIKFSGIQPRKTSIKRPENLGFLEEASQGQLKPIRDSEILNTVALGNPRVSFRPVESESRTGSVRETPTSRKSLSERLKKSLVRFETPQGLKETRNRRLKSRLKPPKLKNRSSLISKKQRPEIGRKKNKCKKLRQKQNLKSKANLNLLADKLGQLRFGNDDLRSRESSSFQDQSHFLDKVSRNQSYTSHNGHLGSRANRLSQGIPSLGVFDNSSQSSEKLDFNFPKPQHNSTGQLIQHQQERGARLSEQAQSSMAHFPSLGGSMAVPSLNLESSYADSSRATKLEKQVQSFSGRTIQVQQSKQKPTTRQAMQVLRTPNLNEIPNLSIFSVNKQEANIKSESQSKAIPFLPNLQSSIKIQKDLKSNEQKRVPVFNLSLQESQTSVSQMGRLIKNRPIQFGPKFEIRDPLVGEKTPSSINHSRLQKNLNAIQFDFSYHTGYETKESIPGFAQFESKESSQMNRSKFDITPLQSQPQNGRLGKLLPQSEMQRNWSINPIPKSAYLDKIRSKFPELKNGLKINENGQMSINDSAFSNQMNLPWMNIQTVKSSSDKFGLKGAEEGPEGQAEYWQAQEESQPVKKKLDFDDDQLENDSVRTANHLISGKELPDFEYSRFDKSMFSADLDSRDSKLTRKQHEPEEAQHASFNLGEELGKLPKNGFFEMDFQVPDIQSQVNDSQFNTSLLDQLNQKEEFFTEAPSNNFVFVAKQEARAVDRTQQSESEDLGFENEGFGPILRELKTQLDAAHYKMFDAKFDVKFEELTRKLKEYCSLERDIKLTESILREGKGQWRVEDQEKLQKIFTRRDIQIGPGKLEWTERLGKVCEGLQTQQFEESLRKLMRDPSGFNSFLILVKKRLSEQQVLFQNSF